MSTKYASALSPEYALLGFLAQQPAHGYQLHHLLTDELGQVWHISLSQTYNILKRLENQGFITGTVQAQEKLPSRQEFHLTENGKARLETWLKATSGSSVRGIRVEFLTRLYFAPFLGPEFPAQVIEQQIMEVQTGLSRLERSRKNLLPEQIINQLSLDLRIRQLQTVLDWLGEVQASSIPTRGRP
jgi:DNA-binding PadR family transcriptional regulator